MKQKYLDILVTWIAIPTILCLMLGCMGLELWACVVLTACSTVTTHWAIAKFMKK